MKGKDGDRDIEEGERERGEGLIREGKKRERKKS